MTKSEIQDKQICLPIIIFEVASMNSFGPATRDPRLLVKLWHLLFLLCYFNLPLKF